MRADEKGLQCRQRWWWLGSQGRAYFKKRERDLSELLYKTPPCEPDCFVHYPLTTSNACLLLSLHPKFASLGSLICTHIFLEPPAQMLNCPHRTWHKKKGLGKFVMVCIQVRSVTICGLNYMCSNTWCQVVNKNTSAPRWHGNCVWCLIFPKNSWTHGDHKYMSLLSPEKEKWPKIEINAIYKATMGKLGCQSDPGLFTNKSL